MNPSKEAELDHILAGTNYTEYEEATEQLGAVRSPTYDAGGVEGMEHREGHLLRIYT